MDRKEIELLIQDYFDASYESDGQKIGPVFHDAAHIYRRAEDGTLMDVDKDAFIERVSSGKAYESYPRQDEIISIEFTGDYSAVAIVKLRVRETMFTDILAFIKLQDKWSVIAKLASAAPVS